METRNCVIEEIGRLHESEIRSRMRANLMKSVAGEKQPSKNIIFHQVNKLVFYRYYICVINFYILKWLD